MSRFPGVLSLLAVLLGLGCFFPAEPAQKRGQRPAQRARVESAKPRPKRAKRAIHLVARVHYNRGLEHSLRGKFELAIPHFKWAIRGNPMIAEAHYNLGAALFWVAEKRFKSVLQKHRSQALSSALRMARDAGPKSKRTVEQMSASMKVLMQELVKLPTRETAPLTRMALQSVRARLRARQLFRAGHYFTSGAKAQILIQRLGQFVRLQTLIGKNPSRGHLLVLLAAGNSVLFLAWIQ